MLRDQHSDPTKYDHQTSTTSLPPCVATIPPFECASWDQMDDKMCEITFNATLGREWRTVHCVENHWGRLQVINFKFQVSWCFHIVAVVLPGSTISPTRIDALYHTNSLCACWWCSSSVGARTEYFLPRHFHCSLLLYRGCFSSAWPLINHWIH